MFRQPLFLYLLFALISAPALAWTDGRSSGPAGAMLTVSPGYGSLAISYRGSLFRCVNYQGNRIDAVISVPHPEAGKPDLFFRIPMRAECTSPGEYRTSDYATFGIGPQTDSGLWYQVVERQLQAGGVVRLKLAFTDGRQWDSNSSQNWYLELRQP